jgi:hypothetical protein
MGLRCSLLGHAFGDTVTERDRETRGAEVVITVREVQRCSRCDTEQVIAENTEVRHLGTGEKASKSDSPAAATEPSESASPDAATESSESASPDASTEPSGSASRAGEPDADAADAEDATPVEESAATAGAASETEGSERSDERPPATGDESTPATSADSGDERPVGDPGGDTEETDQVDVSKYVESAEDPDAGGPGRESGIGDQDPDDGEDTPESPAAESADAEPEPPAAESEDVEFIGGADDDSETESAVEGQTESADEPQPAADAPDSTPEETPSATDEEESEAGGGDILSEGEEPEPTSEDGRSGSAADASPEEEPGGDDEPPEDDAIILDNDEGKAARESDVGRRELAGTGNMFDPSAPEGEGAEGGGDADRSAGSSHDAEAWPGTEQESPRDEEGRRGESEAPVEWPDTERSEDEAAADSSFQFGRDLQGGDEPEPRENPSGLTSEGPVDVVGEDEDPPQSVECPECGYTTEGVGSSLRAGDICPECHRGYLAERR